MRTRIYAKMTNNEVERYLDENDLIFVPVGVTETHGALPLDSETILAEAIGLKMAEAAGGLVLTGLPYFYAGCTNTGRGTVQISVREGLDYLMALARSLLNQGFRRQVYLTFHAPAHLTVGALMRDFFQETKVPILYMDGMEIQKKSGVKMNGAEDFYDIIAGAYDIFGQLDYVPLNEPESDSQSYEADTNGRSVRFASELMGLGGTSCSVGYYVLQPLEHCSSPLVRTGEERSARAAHGRQMIDRMVSGMDVPHIVQTLRELDHYQQDTVLKRYPHLRG